MSSQIMTQYSTPQAQSNLLLTLKGAMEALKPPPRLSVDEWADQERRLDSQNSAEPGRWFTARAEYQREIMRSFSDPSCKEVVLMCGAQLGKSEMLLNLIGYHIDLDPTAILMLQPTLEMAQRFSKKRIANGLLRATPCLRTKVRDPRSRDANNTTLSKEFQGGHIPLSYTHLTLPTILLV